MRHSINRRHAVERIGEDESLTADLVDDAAALLLNWGTTQAIKLPQEELNAHLTNLRRAMKHINREAGKIAPEFQAERVRVLLTEIKTEHIPKVENDT